MSALASSCGNKAWPNRVRPEPVTSKLSANMSLLATLCSKPRLVIARYRLPLRTV